MSRYRAWLTHYLHPRVHWRKLFERKVIFCVLGVLLAQGLEAYFRIHIAGKAGELLTATLLDHVLFGLPIFDE